VTAARIGGVASGAAVPRATYRVQLNAGFTFDDAANIVDYLADLGISHLYVSPVLQARRGSTHGYDVVDHLAVDDERGGEAGFRRLTDALRAHGIGLVVDIVPNHMAIDDERNRWWWDVLERGRASRYAGYFDVDWGRPGGGASRPILLPVLPDDLDHVLASGAIRLARRGGRFVIEHAGHAYPLDSATVGSLVARVGMNVGSDELAADPVVADAVDAELAAINADVDALAGVLDAQRYRLASWRAAASELGYRRFFDVDELIGLRVEDPAVFADTHRLVLDWVRAGLVDGLRVDHPDGLRDPAGYFARLRAEAPDAWIVAEKILAPGEELPGDWPVDGTTGYAFANLATGLLVDRDGEAGMESHWRSVADLGPDWESIAADARRSGLVELLGSDLNRLADLFVTVCEAERPCPAADRAVLHEALREVATAMPVYRTYVRSTDHQVTDADARRIGQAVALAISRRPDIDPELFAFLGQVLRLEVDGAAADELAIRFQQLTPAAMAKGVEDTAFFRHHRLIALNEVGGDPGRFGVTTAVFHDAMGQAAAGRPNWMLALSTHDTKRSADVRARLALLAEDPAGWAAAASELAALAAPHRSEAGPSDADLELLFQSAVGAWPIDADRLVAFMAKATREAKLRTSWTDPNPDYDAAVERLVRGALGDPSFVTALERVVEPLVEPGRRAALAQLALQLTAPGVPDVYEGHEAWDLSLVDPDNRRPVAFDRLRALLAMARESDAAAAWADLDEGLPKLWLLARLLDLRRRRPHVFRGGGYRPLQATGAIGDAVVAFARADEVVTVVPRLVRRVARAGWADTTLALPPGAWRGLDDEVRTGVVPVAELLAAFPVAVLERER